MHDIVPISSSCPAHEKTTEDHEITPVRRANIQTQFLNSRSHKYEAELLTTQTPSLVKQCSAADI
jgi:hypothetical protein